jgi:hypothetical protein
MKKTIILAGLCALFASCADDDANPGTLPPVSGNKVLALKVDLLTNAFEGGKELEFNEAGDFSVAIDYNAPGDFGDITLFYEEVQQPIFVGTIHWMGLGEITYPQFNTPDSFEVLGSAAAQPAEDDFYHIPYPTAASQPYYPYPPDLNAIWDAVDNLELVQAYRQANPSAKVKIFLYTPSVGDGNPEEWDWIIFIKN